MQLLSKDRDQLQRYISEVFIEKMQHLKVVVLFLSYNAHMITSF
ncbi:hypothetical protein RV10_GL004625 [Enterococcus pallens]|nr:hypothetical protein RV10_GL004625 [Enterococcus pallens]